MLQPDRNCRRHVPGQILLDAPPPKAAPASGDGLRHIMRTSVHLTELQHANVQLRLLAALLAASMIFGMLDPALLLLDRTETVIYRAAFATSIGPVGLALAFLGVSAALVPFLAVQLGFLTRVRRGVTKVTCLVLAIAGLLWCFLAWRCLHLDVGHAPPLVFARNGVGALCFAIALGVSLNAEQLRGLLEHA